MRSVFKSEGLKTPTRRRLVSLTDYLNSQNCDSAAEFRQLTAPSHPKADASRQGHQRAAVPASHSDRSDSAATDPRQRTQEK